MRVNRYLPPILVMVALLAPVAIAQAAGVWSTGGRTAVNVATLKPADIKGWMTLQQVIDGLGISQEQLYAVAHVPADVPPSTALKDLEPLIPDFSISVLRTDLETALKSE